MEADREIFLFTQPSFTRFIRNKDLVLVALEKVAQEPDILLPLRSLNGLAAAFFLFFLNKRSYSYGADNI